MKVVGIDLGTTNSVVAVVGEYEDKGMVYGRGKQKVTVLEDDFGRFIQASAVCHDDDAGELVVGDDAKEMAIRGYTPVRFVKKYMGTEEAFRIGKEEWSAPRVSAKILDRMLWIAEQALGERPTRAFVTHPAYFDALAISATREAAELAGLDVDGGMMMEPIAAAMAYTQSDDRDQIRVLVYDLGGGTFDITLVDRTSGSFKPLGFGGNRELGGYNLDKKIATRMLAQIRDKGFVLDIDANHPERDVRWASLMHHAEQVKVILTDKPKAVMRKPGVFTDDSPSPKSVQLNFTITRDEFNELIADEIQETIDATKKVLKDAKVQPADVDHLVLVGGSCRIPVVSERLREEFGIEPEFDEDFLDLSVATGAAMAAATAGTTEGGVELDFIDDRVDLAEVTISGRVLPSEELSDVAGCEVLVEGGIDEETITQTGPDGSFVSRINLYEDDENDLTLTVESPDGKTLLRKSMTVTHDPDTGPGGGGPPPVPLPKCISVVTKSGLFELAKENSILPCEREEDFRTVRELTELPIRIFQEDIQLSELRIRNIDPPAPPNTTLLIRLSIGVDYAMKVTVEIPDLGMSREEEIKLSPPVIPDVAGLRKEFDEISQEYQERMANMPPGDAKGRVEATCGKLVEQLEELFSEEHPERMQAYMMLRRLDLAMHSISDGLKPAQSVVEELLAEARRLLPEAEKKQPAFREQKTGETIDLLETSARTAWQEGDQETWGSIAHRIRRLVDEMKDSMRGSLDLSEFPDPPLLKMVLEQHIQDYEQQVAADTNLSPSQKEDAINQLREAKQKYREVDLSNGDQSKMELIGIGQQHVGPVLRMLGRDDADGVPGPDGDFDK